MASICCSPPESLLPRWDSRSASRGKRPNTRSVVQPPPARARAATVRFSSTVSDGKIRRPCGTSAMPMATIRSELIRVTSAPANITRPDRGGVKPMAERISVVLPMPLRPRRATTWPRATPSETPWRMWLSA